MKLSPSLPLILLLSNPHLTTARIPSNWATSISPSTILNASRMRDRSPSIFVSGGPDTPHLADIIGTCKNEQGGIVQKADCQLSVLETGFCMGLAVLAYRSPTYWAGAFGPNGNNKRALAATDDFFALLPDHLEVSNIKLNGAVLPPDPSSLSLHRRKSGAKEYSVYYKGSLPLTFMVHHKSHSLNENENEIENDNNAHTVPLFAATDGTKMWLTHIKPITTPQPSSSSSPGSSTLKARSGYNGYNHIGAGGIRLLGNSDPIATWDDTIAWLNSRTESGGARPYDYVLNMANMGTFVGHSLRSNVHDLKGSAWGFNGQFGMQGEYHGFSPDWEGDFNWCFGAYPTNC
ncbi:hypothetical protein ONS95_006875 [Cadophora gregata]|uniref:uncharacterized protein n=1 Tax=Cadophora gregata TaxID=51156 RepID=UPI0026DD6852|nr:uncharacterized protein ONS95_006875 [Cadophora gregata]KAK0101720.1 hypothetical protein ONS95_006875 [Cadophora gregata]KAK0106264.1 hypothetical protein ONS96_003905 [Cadophora gregata f. sp. sojae]